MQVSQTMVSNQTPSNVASSIPGPLPFGSKSPWAGERPDRRTKFAKEYKPFQDNEVEDMSDDELVNEAVKDMEDDDTDSDHVPQESEAISLKMIGDLKWDEEPMPEPPQSSNHL